MTQYLIKRVSDLSRDIAKFNYLGLHGVATAGQTTTIDWQITQECWFEGGELVLHGHVNGDRVTMQIVTFVNEVAVVLGEHVTNMAVKGDTEGQGGLTCSYIGLLPAGVYVRMIYTSTGQSDVSVGLNFRRHLPTA